MLKDTSMICNDLFNESELAQLVKDELELMEFLELKRG